MGRGLSYNTWAASWADGSDPCRCPHLMDRGPSHFQRTQRGRGQRITVFRSARPGHARPGLSAHDVEFVTLWLAYWLDEACRAADRCGCLCYSFGRVGACGITEEVMHVHSVSPV